MAPLGGSVGRSPPSHVIVEGKNNGSRQRGATNPRTPQGQGRSIFLHILDKKSHRHCKHHFEVLGSSPQKPLIWLVWQAEKIEKLLGLPGVTGQFGLVGVELASLAGQDCLI